MLAWMKELLSAFGDLLMQVLPLSPFYQIKHSAVVPQGVAWLNWFIDIPGILQIFSAWLVAYGLYLLYRIILRWIKAVS